jgi:hypothetical protein
MGIPHLIKNFALHISPSWNKHNGDHSSETHIKAKNVAGDIAGRDIYKTVMAEKKPEDDLPHVFFTGAFGGNGHVMHLGACETHNLSEQFIYLERIEVLGGAIPFGGSTIVKAGESLRHTGNDLLSYPTSDEHQYLDIFFHYKNGKHYCARQTLQLAPFLDNSRYNVVGLSEPVIISVD